MSSANALVWDGSPGHYEVYYVSITDDTSGVGLWIRYTMLAPQAPQDEPTCSLWFMAMDPRPDAAEAVIARKATFPVSRMQSAADPFSLRIGDAVLDDHGMRGALEDVSWELSWQPRLPAYEHVHPLLRRARVAKTVLVLPHPDLEVAGSVTLPAGGLTLEGARGGQAHLWGSKHATRWAWIHCNDLRHEDGSRCADSFVDAVSVFVPRLGREVGPNTPVVARFAGEDFRSTSPLRVLANSSVFSLTSWELQARDGRRRLRLDVDAPRELLVGVTYHDPDGETAHCYNTEVASLRLSLDERTGSGEDGWTQRLALRSEGGAHFEYAQRPPLGEVPLHLTT